MRPPAASESSKRQFVQSADADPAAGREPEQTPAAPPDGALGDEQLNAVAGGALRAAVRPLLSSSPAFGALPPDEQKAIAKDL